MTHDEVEVTFDLDVSRDLKSWNLIVSADERISTEEYIKCVRSFLNDLEHVDDQESH